MHVHYCLMPLCASSIQVACLRSLRSNQVERLNQDPAMHVDSLLCANEAGEGGGERSTP